MRGSLMKYVFDELACKNILQKCLLSNVFSWDVKRAISTSTEETEREIKHHSKFASDWWSLNGSMKGLHALNELRVPFIRDGLISNHFEKKNFNEGTILEGFKLLEVGCGGGILTECLANLHAEVTGIDLSEDLIAVAKEHSLYLKENIQKKISYKVEAIEIHAKENKEYYDGVILSEVIEHIDNKVDFITSSLETLKVGGSIFITTPNKTFLSMVGLIGFGEYIAGILPKGTHHFNKFISPLDLQRILRALNCETILINGMAYNFINNRWCWTSSRSLCYAMQAIKLS